MEIEIRPPQANRSNNNNRNRFNDNRQRSKHLSTDPMMTDAILVEGLRGAVPVRKARNCRLDYFRYFPETRHELYTTCILRFCTLNDKRCSTPKRRHTHNRILSAKSLMWDSGLMIFFVQNRCLAQGKNHSITHTHHTIHTTLSNI